MLSGEADATTRRQMEDAAARYAEAMQRIRERHGSARPPEVAEPYYMVQHLVYSGYLAWGRAQQVLYQTLGTPAAVATLQEANDCLTKDRRQADKLRWELVRYMRISRQELNQMMRDAGVFEA